MGEHEPVLRAEAARLVEAHWPSVERITAELLLHERLDGAEVEVLFDGVPEAGVLERYRSLREGGVT